MNTKGPFLCKGLPDLQRARSMKLKPPLYRIPSSSSSRHSIRFTYRYCTLRKEARRLKYATSLLDRSHRRSRVLFGLPGTVAAFLVLNETCLKVSIGDLKTKPGIGMNSSPIKSVPAGGRRRRRGHQNGLFTAAGLGTDHERRQRCDF